MIYLDNAATTVQKPQCVIDAVTTALTSGTGNCGRGMNKASLEAGRTVYGCREAVARLFGFPAPVCISFTSNSTEALNTAIMGLIDPSVPGQQVVTTAAEHNSVLRPLYFQKNNGVRLDIAPIGADGVINYRALEKLLSEHTRALVITMASNVTGNITDFTAVGAMLRRLHERTGHKPLLILDASQAAGSLSINAADLDGQGTRADVLCFTGHKSLMGPQGTGGICVMPDITVRPLKRGGSGIRSFDKEHPSVMPEALEAGTLNTHGLAGLSAAVSYIQQEGIDAIHAHEQKLTQLFYDGVRHIPGIRLYGDFRTDSAGKLYDRAPIVSLNIGDTDSAEVSDILSTEYGIATRAGAHCAPLVHKSFGTEAQGMVRFSFGWFTTEQDIAAAVNALAEIQKDIVI